jgi:hypothetical protein
VSVLLESATLLTSISVQLCRVRVVNTVVAASIHADTFFTLSALGDVTAHTLRNEVFEQLIKHRHDNSKAQKVETSVYCRKFNNAFESLVSLSREPRPPRTYTVPFEEELIEQCMPKPAIQESAWGISSLPADARKMSEIFQKELNDYGFSIPPGFERFPQWTKIIKQFNQIQFNLLALRLKLINHVQEGDWQFVLKKETEIIKGMEQDPEFMDMETFSLIMEAMLVKSHLKALSMGLKVGQLLSDVPSFDFATLAPLMGTLIFPTVYDGQRWLPTQEAIRSRKEDRQFQMGQYLSHVNDLRQTYEDEKAAMMSNISSNKSGRRRMVLNVNSSQKDSKINDTLEQRNKSVIPIVSDSKQVLPMVSLEMYHHTDVADSSTCLNASLPKWTKRLSVLCKMS